MIRIQLSRLLGEKRLTQADISRMTGIRAGTINDLYHEIAARIGEESYRLMKAHYADGVPLMELANRSHISLGALKMKMCRWKKKCTGIVA